MVMVVVVVVMVMLLMLMMKEEEVLIEVQTLLLVYSDLSLCVSLTVVIMQLLFINHKLNPLKLLKSCLVLYKKQKQKH